MNSWFESMSGFTTSGATVLSHSMSPNCIPGTTPDCINAQPQGLLLWRSLTQWLGGMGVVMLGMLVLSRIIGGGMALARAELTGLPCRDFAQSCARPPWRCGASTCS